MAEGFDFQTFQALQRRLATGWAEEGGNLLAEEWIWVDERLLLMEARRGGARLNSAERFKNQTLQPLLH